MIVIILKQLFFSRKESPATHALMFLNHNLHRFILAVRKEVLSCGTETTIECPEPSVIQMLGAFYGRKNRSACAEVSGSTNTNCSTPVSIPRIASHCNGKTICNVNIADYFTISSNQCEGISRYLQLTYLCGSKYYIRIL